MKRIVTLLGLFMLLASGCLLGCKITTKNQGECGFRYGTEFTFFSRSAKTADEPATIESESQPLEAWIKSKSEPTPDQPVVNP